jgi:hypothetical protein
VFQVVAQLAMRQLEAKLKLPAPASNRAGKKHRKKKQRPNRIYFDVGRWRWNTADGQVFKFTKQPIVRTIENA